MNTGGLDGTDTRPSLDGASCHLATFEDTQASDIRVRLPFKGILVR